MSGLAADVAALLRAHGADATRLREIEHDGFSGARLWRVSDTLLLKRVRYADDWIMQTTRDASCREAQFAASALATRLPHEVAVASLGAARDGDGWAILMRDISACWITDALVPDDLCERIIDGLAALHAAYWARPPDDSGIDWCAVPQRLAVTSPATADALVRAGRDFGIAGGWRRFFETADARAAHVARRLFDEPAPLLRLLDALPQTLVHSDAKIANVGWGEGRLWLIDWALVARAPAALELAWFLAVNSSRLPWPPDAVMQSYERRLRQRLTAGAWSGFDLEAHRAAVALVGLLQYGWGKALDARAGDAAEFRWWCDRAADAARFLRW